MTPEQKLGQLIKDLRNKKGYNLQELAEKVGVNYVHISYVEKGLRIPSDELLAKLAKVLSDNAKHEKEIREKMFLLLAQIKSPKEIQNRISLKNEDEIILEVSMPQEFIEKLKKDIEEKKISPKIFDKFGIPYALIQKVIDGKAYLSRTDTIKLAQLLHSDVNDYLLKAGYLPEEFEEFLDKKAVFSIMRSLKELPPEDFENVLSVIEAILKNFKKRQK